MKQPMHYIDSDDLLFQHSADWQSLSVVALDTEFIRTDTFYPIAGLIQLSTGSDCYLIDPLEIKDFSPLIDLFENKSIHKILHSCSEDLEVFDRLLGVLPEPLFDTQIGAALSGLGFSVSYQNVVEQLIGVHVPKGETRSDWLRRPLSDGQIHYAALDVEYLHQVYDKISKQLTEHDRMHWWQDESQAMIDKFRDSFDLSAYYTRVKSAWKLNRRQLATLVCVVTWREQQARERNTPRGRVIKDRSLFEIAQMQPKRLEQLSDIGELHPKAIRKEGETLLELVEQARSLNDDALPELLPKPLPPAAGGVIKLLKAYVKERAQALNVAPEMLVRKRDYEMMMRNKSRGIEPLLPNTLSGWRKSVVGDELVAILEREYSR